MVPLLSKSLLPLSRYLCAYLSKILPPTSTQIRINSTLSSVICKELQWLQCTVYNLLHCWWLFPVFQKDPVTFSLSSITLHEMEMAWLCFLNWIRSGKYMNDIWFWASCCVLTRCWNAHLPPLVHVSSTFYLTGNGTESEARGRSLTESPSPTPTLTWTSFPDRTADRKHLRQSSPSAGSTKSTRTYIYHWFKKKMLGKHIFLQHIGL